MRYVGGIKSILTLQLLLGHRRSKPTSVPPGDRSSQELVTENQRGGEHGQKNCTSKVM